MTDTVMMELAKMQTKIRTYENNEKKHIEQLHARDDEISKLKKELDLLKLKDQMIAKNQSYLEIRIEVCDEDSVPSVTDLWGSANWHEREAFDMMGIKFENHPNFKRILLADDWEGHPLRNDYDTPEYYRGMPVPKDKTYWE